MAVAAGDFSGDHRPDLVIWCWNDGAFTLLNTGGGAVGRPIPVGVDVNVFARSFLMTADVNGDGKVHSRARSEPLRNSRVDDLATPRVRFQTLCSFSLESGPETTDNIVTGSNRKAG